MRICDLGKPPFDADGWLSLPIPKLADFRKLGLTAANSQAATSAEAKATLKIQIVDMTRFDAAVGFNPNRSIIEDRPRIGEYTLKQTNAVLLRTKLTIALLEWSQDSDDLIFYFYYPRFSYLCWAAA